MSDEFDEMDSTVPDDANSQVVARLEKQLEDIKRSRNEDRFLFLLVALILIDVYIFSHIDNWGGSIAILVLEFIMLLVVGKRFDVLVVEQWLDKFVNTVGSSNNHE